MDDIEEDNEEHLRRIETIIDYIHRHRYRPPRPEHEIWVRQMIRDHVLIPATKKLQHHPVFSDTRSSSMRQAHFISAIKSILFWNPYHCSYCLTYTSER